MRQIALPRVRSAFPDPKSTHAALLSAACLGRGRQKYFFALASRAMPEMVACLKEGKVLLLTSRPASKRLVSPLSEASQAEGMGSEQVVGLSRGRAKGSIRYATSDGRASSVFERVPGSDRAERLFHGVQAAISEIDSSFGGAAIACTVAGEGGTSAVGLLADDGKGVRTVTEGDVIDCMPRFAPSGRAEIVYASAGIGRTASGTWAGLTPFALHRLRFADYSVEVLVADAKYDYLAPVAVAESEFYAIRRAYRKKTDRSAFSVLSSLLRGAKAPSARAALERMAPRDNALVRVNTEGTRVIADGALAFDVASNGYVVFATRDGVFELAANGSTPDQLSSVANVEQLVIY